MEPIAIYKEVRFESNRVFELYSDRLRVTGKAVQIGKFELNIQLATLHPQPSRLWTRGLYFRYGCICLFIAFFSALGSYFVQGIDFLSNTWTMTLLILFTVAGFVLVLPQIKPVEFARFQNDSGIVVLDIGKAGPLAKQFDEFIETLIKSIVKLKGSTVIYSTRIL